MHAGSRSLTLIQLKELTRHFGDKVAVDRISLEIPQGQLVGYLGPNGAGKTTTVKMLTGMMKPTAGTAAIHGKDIVRDNIDVKRIVGYVPDSGAVFESLTGMEYLELVGRLHGIEDSAIRARVEKFAEFFLLGLDVLDGDRLSAYSHGMRQKVIITAALLHNPAVVFFDEPLNGLDANIVVMFKELIRSLARDGKTIFFCSHIMDVVERMCERIIVINEGRVVADGTLDSLQQATGGQSLESIFQKLTTSENLLEKAEAFSRELSDGA
jgi:ABC-2 type transport system ATP-binding protein